MLDISARRRGKAEKKLPPEGVYNSVVIDVRWAENYEPETAYEIEYRITAEDGTVYRHKEIFKTDLRNKRTAKFENYLAQNGINDLDDFKGQEEKLTFKHVSKDGNVFFNIDNREFVYGDT